MTRTIENTIGKWLDRKYASSPSPAETLDEWKTPMMEYFRGLTDPKAETSIQLATAKWFCNGTVILPEDQDKCTAAVKTALHNKVDPLAFKRPMEIIERFGEFQERVGMRPEDVPTFKLLREKDGLQIWSVDGGEDAYEHNRAFCMSHFGNDLPWCLTRNYKHWKHYDAYPKELATLDGKPIAFSANDYDERIWWDRLDAPDEDISVTRRIPGDRLHRVGTKKADPQTLEPKGEWSGIHVGDRKNGKYMEWKSVDEASLMLTAEYKDGEVISVEIEDGVVGIGEDVFRYCTSLMSIHIPDSVTEIGGAAFYECESLAEIHIPDSVTEIRGSTFYDCKSLTEIHISNGVTKIGEDAFHGCGSLAEIRIPDGVKKIEWGVFAGCKSLTGIRIPGSVTEIGEDAFYGCSSLAKIHISDGVTKIGDRAFIYCESLTDIRVPDSVTKIGRRAFESCKSLAEIHIPDGVTEIGENAFRGCESLKEIRIPDGVTGIGVGTFKYCTSLTEIHIPDSVTKIGWGAFDGCKSLREIHIPDSVKKIEGRVFSGCTTLTNIHIPDSVTKIGKNAFKNCNVNITCSPKVAELLKGQRGIRSITVVSRDRAQSPDTGYKQESSVRNYGISPNLLKQAWAEYMKGDAREVRDRSAAQEQGRTVGYKR